MNKLIVKTLLFVVCFGAYNAMANSSDKRTIDQIDNNIENNIEDKLRELKLEKIQADMIVAQLEESGRLDEGEVKAVKREIASVEEDALAEISKQPH
jgi:hypothetical protein